MAAPAAAKKPGIGRGVLAPALAAALALWILGSILGSVLGDTRTLAAGLVLAWLAFTSGRILAHADLPRTRGLVARKVATGLALGIVAKTMLDALFLEGPGWPYTPWWALAAGLGFGIHRAHAPVLKAARDVQDDGRRVLRLFHRADIEALAYLVGGYALLGLGAGLALLPFLRIVPGGGRFAAIALAMYALYGVRLLLRFASEERASRGVGVVGWLKANALQNAIVVLALVAYATFRDQLARAIPYFALVEFGLGVAVFSFVLARLRAKIRREGSLLATASAARDHQRVITELREAEHEALARPVARFLETGTGIAEYAVALRASAGLDEASASRVLAPLAEHREPARTPALPLAWAMGAGLASAAGFLAAGIAAALVLFEAEWPYPLYLGLLLLSFSVYALQDRARAHLRPGLAAGIAAAGVALLFADALLVFATMGMLGQLPGIVWGVIGVLATLMLGIPALSSWRLHKRIVEGKVVDARRVPPARELADEVQKARRRAATMALAAFAILLPVPWFVGWLAERVPALEGFHEFFGRVIAVGIWVVAGLGAAALLRFYGLTRHRPRLLAQEKEKRDRRLALHRSLMRTIEKV